MKTNICIQKTSFLLTSLVLGGFLLASDPKPKIDNDNIGIKYKKDQGIFVTDISAKIIGLKMTDVKEELLHKTRHMIAQIYDVSTPNIALASSWIPLAEANALPSGTSVTSTTGNSGRITGLSRLTVSANMNAEVLLEIENKNNDFKNNQFIHMTAVLPETGTILVVPKSSVLNTSEGTFVYVDNAGWKVRTPIVVGMEHEGMVEIVDGLLSGDVVVASPVMTLWMTELQLTKSGKPCSCGH